MSLEVAVELNWDHAFELEFMLFCERNIDILRDLNTSEAGVEVCERCSDFHPDLAKAPVRTMYADGSDPQPLLCPICTEEWNEHWDEMWADYHRGCL